MKNKRTYYHLILDRSGSMNACIEETIEGVNQQINRIREVSERFPDQELVTSLTIFNNRITRVWSRLLPTQLRALTFSDYRPEGTTALLDAIGITVSELQRVAGPELDADEASVVVVVITDGYENSSVTWSRDQTASLIKELEMTGRWTFSYLGATLDAIEIAESLNIKKFNAMHFNVNDQAFIYNKLNNSLDHYMNGKQKGKIKNDFLDETEK